MAIFNHTKLIDYNPTSGTLPVRTEFENGSIQSVNRYTKHYVNVHVSFILSLVEANQFLSWFSNHGHQFFDMTNPITNTTESYRIISEYSLSKIDTNKHFSLTFTVEYLV